MFEAGNKNQKLNEKNCETNDNFYTLSFQFTFDNSLDRVYFAYARPYTYMIYNNYISKILYQISPQSQIFEFKINENFENLKLIEKPQNEFYSINFQSSLHLFEDKNIMFISKEKSLYFKREVICYTQGNLPLSIFTISDIAFI